MGRWLVTPLQNEDRAAWAALFRGYLDFYEVSASAEKLDTVWAWLHAADHELNGIVVRRSAGDEPVGLAHYRPFPRPLHGTVGCYLDDLFVEPGSRGTGAVDALLTMLREIAAASGWDTVRWITRSGNARARSTYERLAQRTDLITYDMAPSTVTGTRSRPAPAAAPTDHDHPHRHPRKLRYAPAQASSHLARETIVVTERIDPPVIADERDMLRGFLDYHRATLAMKCDGLSDEDLRRQSMPPSTLSLLGLVRHLAEVERAWFRRVINGEGIPLVWSREGDYQVAYDASAATRSEAFDAWQAEVEQSRRIEAAAESLDIVRHASRAGEDVSLRLVMLHVLLEYARHNGHADFLREGVDGTVGP